MTAIKVDPDWVSGYAKKVAENAEALGAGAEVLNTAPLAAEAFGSLGRTVRIAESYGRAAEVLRGQLTRAVEALESAADSLGQVAEHYAVSEGDSVREINRSGQA
ncbi:hypothetical protein [Actinokineospora xionganensis]|uniref:Excreted virulence factor EspC (Type VII ESX diderm) n=1 Tax=Actinokineospora xionganensis TaxID=2684470 RepID=A0ABR7L0X5_9PSEU|nr:hypothetical protein [Actinokineospora xionganensis]MBC6446330.1 hypothetical protein [Actinokineospora xionganensis]